MKISVWCLLAPAFLLCAACSAKNEIEPAEKPVVKFGLVADIQYADCDSRGSRFYRKSLEKLDECTAELNRENVQFTINLGDTADRSPADFDAVLAKLRRLNAPVYNTTGNHDYGKCSDNEKLFRTLGMPAEYYAFSEKNWRFVMLNTNEIAPYSNVSGTPKAEELAAMSAQIKKAGKKNGLPWNGGISARQMAWLAGELESAQKNKMNVLVFAHHPLYPASGYTALNSDEILELLSRYSCVKAVFGGHHHAGGFGVYKNIPCITAEGMIETENENAYGIVRIFEDRIVLTGKGRAKSRTLPLTPATPGN